MRLPFEIAKSAKFPEGKEMSAEEMAEYLAKGGNPEAGKEWKENNDEHQDVVKDKNKEAFQRLLPVERKVAYGPGKKITVKDLEEIGGNMLEGDEDLEALAKQLNSAGGARRVEKAMRDADKILGTHGVEAVFEEGDYDGDAAMTYLNAGDTYAATLVYDVGEDDLYVSTWGDWVEWAERKGRQMRASAKKTATDDADSVLRALGEGTRPLKDVAQALGWLDHGPGGIHATEELLGLLAKKGLVSERSGKWSLTSKGEKASEKVRVRRSASLASKTACGPDCSCGGNCMGKCQTKAQEPGTLVWASEQEAEKLQAEAQAAEAQAEADRQKAEAAQLREASDLLPLERMKLGEKYPWDECIADQRKEYGDKETAEKVCGAIRAKSQFGKGAKQKLPVELKEHQFTEEDNPNPKGNDKDGDGETNEPSPIKEASAPETVAGWLSWREKSA